MDLLGKIRQWPESRKKFLLSAIVIILGIFLLKFYIANIQKKLESLKGEKLKEQFQIEKIKTEFYKGEEELKKWEEEFKKFYENLQKNEQGGTKNE